MLTILGGMQVTSGLRQFLYHYSTSHCNASFQFSQHLTNLTFFVHSEIGTRCKFWMQTIEEGKAWLQLSFAMHTFYILMEFGACDWFIYNLRKPNTGLQGPSNKPNYIYLPPDRQQGYYASFLLSWLLWGLTQSPQRGNRTTRFNGLELDGALQTNDIPFSKQILKVWSQNSNAWKAHF